MQYKCRNQIIAQPHFHDIVAYDERYNNYEIMMYIADIIYIYLNNYSEIFFIFQYLFTCKHESNFP